MIVTAQHCISRDPYFDKYIQSETQPGIVYKVRINNPGDHWTTYICNCPSFQYRGYCKHQEKIGQLGLCRWHELIGPEKQTPQQANEGICPRCGNMTTEDLEDDGK